MQTMIINLNMDVTKLSALECYGATILDKAV